MFNIAVSLKNESRIATKLSNNKILYMNTPSNA